MSRYRRRDLPLRGEFRCPVRPAGGERECDRRLQDRSEGRAPDLVRDPLSPECSGDPRTLFGKDQLSLRSCAFEDGVRKALAGMTTLEEVISVTSSDIGGEE